MTFREHIFPFKGDQSLDPLLLRDTCVLSYHISDAIPSDVAQSKISPEVSKLSFDDSPLAEETLKQVTEDTMAFELHQETHPEQLVEDGMAPATLSQDL